MEIREMPIRVLLIEDDEDDFHLIRNILSEISTRSYRLEWLSDCDAGMKSLLGGSFDVCLLDYRLGEENGLELLGRISKNGCKTPIIFLTGQGDHYIDLEAMRAGADDYLAKEELSPGLLERSIRHSVERARVKELLKDAYERERAALKESEESGEKYRCLFEMMAQGVIYQGADGRIIDANPAAQRILGLTLEQMKGKTSIDPQWRAIHEDGSDFPGETHPSMIALRTGDEVCNVVMGIYNSRLADYRWINVNAVPRFRSGEDIPYQVFTTFEDVTERKRAEESNLERGERLRLFFEHAPASLAMFDRDMCFLSASRRWLSDYHLGERDLIGLSHYEVFPEVSDRWKEVHRRALAGEVVKAENDRFERADGTVQWLRREVRPWYDQRGDVGGIVIFSEDITAIKQAEEELIRHRDQLETLVCERTAELESANASLLREIKERKLLEQVLSENEEKYRTMFMDSPAAYLILIDGIFVDCNRAAEDMFGSDRTHILGKRPESLSPEFQPDGKRSSVSAEEKIQAAFRTGRNTFEWVHCHADGSEFFVEVSIAAMTLNGQPVLFTTWMDITQRKQAEAVLEESRRRLEVLSKTDGLTGIANRRCFDEVIHKEYGRHVRSGLPLSLVLLDIDHFKAFNDYYGHMEGDECLKQVARTIADAALRPGDFAARYGGEEFACILPATDRRGAKIVAERIRKSIESLAIPHKGSNIAEFVTVSLGVVTLVCSSAGSVGDILTQVDELLYKAKTLGRNQVVSDSEEQVEESSRNTAQLVRLLWKDSFRSGNHLIDSQHQTLFEIANELIDMVLALRSMETISSIVSRLIDEVSRHFLDEEQILSSANFPGLSEHVEAHRLLLEKARGMATDLTDGAATAGNVFQFLVHDMVLHHMLTCDQEFFAQIAC